MIVRILGEGQVEISGEDIATLNALDDELLKAVDTGEHDGFHSALTALLAKVRELGHPIADDELIASDLVLPSPDASLTEVQALLTDEGLIPG